MLEQCLTALERSDLRPVECVVVQDGSTDDSAAVAERHGARVIVLHEQQGPAHARNIGVRLAQGDLILFLDADVCIHPDAIQRIVEHFRRDPSLDAVIGAYDDSPAAPPFISQYRNLLHCFTHRAGHRDAGTFWSGCGAVRKEAFMRCGGLDERYERPAIEDIEFGYRLKAAGGRILLDPAVQVKHLKCWTLGSMIKTDVFDRGVPWTRLILRAGRMPNDLNVCWSQRLSVAMSFLSVAALACGSGITALACVLAVLGLNLPFFIFLAGRRRIWFVLRSLPVHLLFHFYSGVAFALGVGAHLLSAFGAAASAAAPEETR
jgi:GT2 family glycosyltransferase